MKRLITCFFAFLLATSLNAQQTNIDSLEKRLQSLSTSTQGIGDTIRVDLMNELAQLYLRVAPQRALELGNEAVSLSETIGYKTGLAAAYNNLGTVNRMKGSYPEALKYHEKALSIGEKQGDKALQAVTLKNIGNVYFSQGQYPDALQYYRLSLDILEKVDDKYGLAVAYNNIGLVYKNQGNYDKALEAYQQSFDIFEEIGNQKGLASSYNNFGMIYTKRGDISKALESYLESVRIVEEIGDKVTQSSILNNIGNIYFQQENYANALEFYERSLQLKRELGDKSGIAVGLSNIGGVYSHQGNYIKALENTLEALKIQEQIGDKKGIITTLNNIGDYYEYQGLYDKSLQYLLRSLEMQEDMGHNDVMPTTLILIGSLYSKKQDYNTALEYFFDALKIAREKNMSEQVKTSYQRIAGTYSLLNNAAKTFEYYNKYNDLKDSLNNEQNNTLVAEMQTRFESERKQKENELLLAQIELNEAKAQQRTYLLYTLAGLALLVALLLVLLYGRYRAKQRINLQLERKNVAINQQKEKITSSITYAKRIQDAILPRVENIRSTFPDSFILFKPKEIVSGDFYWFAKKNEQVYIAAVDCTGHGVPGAFMSMIGNDLLNQIINIQNINEPGLILNNLHEDVQSALKQEDQSGNHDGMDIALCKIDTNTNELEFASANRVLYLYKNNKEDLVEIKGDMKSIGGLISMGKRDYSSHKIKLDKGDSFYIFSDGLTDQFGGGEGKKFGAKNLKAFIYSHIDKPMEEQGRLLSEKTVEWINGFEQVDDILVIGIRV